MHTVSAVSLMLAACGGGGGGGGTVPTSTVAPVVTPFTSWSAVQPGSTVSADGLGQRLAATWDGTKITPTLPPEDAAVHANFAFDASGNLTAVGLTYGTATPVGFTPSQIGAFPDFVAVRNSTSTSQGVISNPKSLAWNYQSFGVWETGLGTANRSFYSMSVGAPTASTAIPGSGTADFIGKVVGSYVDVAGSGHTVLADLTVGADFGAQSLTFGTSNSQTSPDGTTFTPASSLDMSGTLTYTAGTNGFSGQLQTAGGLSGKSTGQFYGPTAQELGGVFSLNNGGIETYSGAYGAKH